MPEFPIITKLCAVSEAGLKIFRPRRAAWSKAELRNYHPGRTRKVDQIEELQRILGEEEPLRWTRHG